MASKLFDQLDNQEIDSYTTGDYASHGEQMLHCWYVANCFRNCPKRNDWAENYVK